MDESVPSNMAPSASESILEATTGGMTLAWTAEVSPSNRTSRTNRFMQGDTNKTRRLEGYKIKNCFIASVKGAGVEGGCEASACSTEFPTPPIIGDESAIPFVRAAPGDGVFNSFDEAPGMGIALDLDVGVEDAPEMSNAELLVKSLTRVAVVVVEETLE